MFYSGTGDIYDFVLGGMSLQAHSIERDLQGLRLLLADMKTTNILNERGIGTHRTIFHVTQNESKASVLVTRLTYCQGGRRFTHPECALLIEQITDLGHRLSNKRFDTTMNEVKRFIANEADFMKEQAVQQKISKESLMYASTATKSDHIDSSNNTQNHVLINYERNEFGRAPAAVLYDAVGAVVNDGSNVGIILRLMDMEGGALFLRVMKNLSCQENVLYFASESDAMLTASDATLLEFTCNLGKHTSNEFFTRFLRNSQLARELIGNIIRIGNDAPKFLDDNLSIIFECCMIENSSWKNQRHFKDNFGL